MNPKDRNTSSNDPTTARREPDPQNTPLSGAPGSERSWNDDPARQQPSNRPTGGTSAGMDDEDVDEGGTRQAGASNPGSRRESPDDAMRRERGQREPEQSGGTSERNPDDRTNE